MWEKNKQQVNTGQVQTHTRGSIKSIIFEALPVQSLKITGDCVPPKRFIYFVIFMYE